MAQQLALDLKACAQLLLLAGKLITAPLLWVGAAAAAAAAEQPGVAGKHQQKLV